TARRATGRRSGRVCAWRIAAATPSMAGAPARTRASLWKARRVIPRGIGEVRSLIDRLLSPSLGRAPSPRHERRRAAFGDELGEGVQEPGGMAARRPREPVVPVREHAADPVAELDEVVDAPLDGFELLGGERARRVARSAAALARGEHDMQLLEREAQ